MKTIQIIVIIIILITFAAAISIYLKQSASDKIKIPESKVKPHPYKKRKPKIKFYDFKKLEKRYPNIFKLINTRIKYTVLKESVIAVFDGDTVKTNKHIIRMLGIDTPEISHGPDEVDQPGSREATKFTVKELSNKELTLICDDANKFDKYDRLVALIIYDTDKIFNIEIMKAGYARPRYYWLSKLVVDKEWKKFNRYFKYWRR